MDEYQPHDRFDMDGDYEGGQWIDGEYFYTNKRQKTVQTKEDQLYGDWGNSDSDEERRGNRGRAKADYARPVGFVSSGVAKPTQEADRQASSANQKQQAADAQPGSGTGLGFAGPALPEEEDEAEVDSNLFPSAFGQSVLRRAEEKRKQGQQQQKAEKTSRGAASQPHSDLPAFEKHSKGIGSKLMAMMGYKAGEGLGRTGQGIAKPVETKLRPKNMGMGYNDYTEQKLQPAVEDKPAAAEAKKPTAAGKQRYWRKKDAEQRVRRVYRTPDEILQEAAEKPKEAPRQTILDMRGPQARMVTNMEHLNMAEDGEGEDKTPMPELQHNLKLLVDLAEADIQRLDGKLRHEKDTAVVLGREKDRWAAEVDAAAARTKRLGLVQREVALCTETAASQASISMVQERLLRLQHDFNEEYIMYNLAAVSLSQALPRMAALFRGWQPLSDPTHGLQQVSAWRPLLESPAARDSIFQEVAATNDPYTQLVGAVVLPGLSMAVTNEWEPRNPEPLLQFMDAWEPHLPRAALQHVLHTLILPKLSSAIEAWEPRSETVALHAWVHPWLPMLGDRLSDLYPGIRHKLTVALQQWHPSDSTVHNLLSPWHTVFDAKDWESLMSRSIVPKLSWALQSVLATNPMQPDLAALQWVLAWQDVMPQPLMVALFEGSFFPSWHGVLRHWLSGAPNFDEVTSWYIGWKNQLPQDLLDNERIRAQLNAALNAMNSAASSDHRGGPQPYHYPPPQAPMSNGSYGPAQAQSTAAPSWSGAGVGTNPPLPPSNAEPTLRELIEGYAEDKDIEFLPKVGRVHEGLQVYGFGPVSIILDNSSGMIQAQLKERWTPVSLDDLVAEVRRRQAASRK